MRGALGFQGQSWQGYNALVPSLCCAEGGCSTCSRVPSAGTPFAEGARGSICGFAASWLAKGHMLLCLLDAFPCLLPETHEGWRSLGRGRGRGCWLSEWLAWSVAVHPDGLCCSPAGQGWSKLLTQTMSWRVTSAWSFCSPFAHLGQCLWCPRALLYLQELAEELTSVYQPPAPTEGAQEPDPERIQKKRRSRRRKEEETDSDDPARDADFVPSKEVLLQAEEEEGSDAPLSEVSEPELEVVRGHGGRTSSSGVRPRSLSWLLLTFGPA